MSAPTFKEMRKMEKKQLEEKYGAAVGDRIPSADQYLQEIWRRDQAEQAEAILRLTQIQTKHTAMVRWLTWVILVLTAVVMVATLLQLAIAIKLI